MMQGTRHPGERGGAASWPQQNGRDLARQDQDPRPPSTYNFVPLSAFVHLPAWAEEVSHDVPFEDGYCGEIEYTLTARTPILVAGPKSGDNVKEFLTRPDAQGKPRAIIPGSSVRGMLRNVLEIASFGKFQRVGNRAPNLPQKFRRAYEEWILEAVASVNPAHLGSAADLAELIFGRVPGPQVQVTDRALRGRVGFDTLHEVAVNGEYAAELTPPPTILGAPRPSFFPYYVHQPSAGREARLGPQRYSSDGCLDGTISRKERDDYSSFSAQSWANRRTGATDRLIPTSQPRGWKRYPARPCDRAGNGGDPVPREQRNIEADLDEQARRRGKQPNLKIRVALRPRAEGVTFSGRIRFHNLREVELSALLWAMTWGHDTDREQWHSLGMGKPFGWGGCTIKVKKIIARRNDSHSAAFSDLTREAAPGSALREAFVKHMEGAYAQWNAQDASGAACVTAGWTQSEQIQELRAMADPAMSADERSPQQLRYPWAIPGGVKAFANLKEDGMVLPRYGGHWGDPGSREGRERARRDAVRGLGDDGREGR